MTEESESRPRFELKPIDFGGRVWEVHEWATVWLFLCAIEGLWVSFFFPSYYLISVIFPFVFWLAVFGYLQAKSDAPISKPFTLSQSSDGENVSESKLPSKAEAAEWAKKNSEYFVAWNKRQYKASKSWFGQKREDFSEWQRQRKLARYQTVAASNEDVATAVGRVMGSTDEALEDDAMAKMLEVDSDLEPVEAVPVEADETVAQSSMIDYDRVPGYFRKATRIFYGLLLGFYALAMINFSLNVGFFGEFFYAEFIVDRLLSEYSSTQMDVVTRAIILSTLFLCVSLLMLIGYRPFVTISLLSISLILSIMMRLDYANPLDGVYPQMAIDIACCIFFLIFCSITFFAREPDIVHPLLGPQELISASSDKSSGGRLELMKPKRPNRRARPLFFYEGVFLLLSMILWPTSLFSLAALASAELRATWGLPSDFDSGTMSGQLFMGILFGLSAISTYIVYKFDREARDAPMYAKEMEAYVKHMDHWININNDFYEREHARLTSDLNASSDEE